MPPIVSGSSFTTSTLFDASVNARYSAQTKPPQELDLVTTMCVYCGDSVMDATPDSDDVAQWYAKYPPALPVGSRVPDVCPDCNHQYAVGEKIKIRGDSQSTLLVVTGIAETAGLPEIIVASHPDGRELCLAKSQLRLVSSRESETEADVPKKEEGYF